MGELSLQSQSESGWLGGLGGAKMYKVTHKLGIESGSLSLDLNVSNTLRDALFSLVY